MNLRSILMWTGIVTSLVLGASFELLPTRALHAALVFELCIVLLVALLSVPKGESK